MFNPKVTVIMPVYNSEDYLYNSINSILNQTFKNLEFLIFNDGSTDKSAEIIQSYSDPRIKFYNSYKNCGHVVHLNRGIDLAQGQYIARMDSDDIALPKRLEKQVTFLEKHPEVGILGSYCWLINELGQKLGIYPVPLHDLQIRWTSLLANPFAHPTVILRRDVLRENNLNYNISLQAVED
ncbi:MAG: glycosyltransferase family 2 protein, partial [Microcystaceae cyanobacterium]